MATTVTATKMDVEGVAFPAFVAFPGSSKTHLLAGAGVRGLDIGCKFVVFTAIGIYLESETAVSTLAKKWKGKDAQELAASLDFFRDIWTGPFEKFTRVTAVLPLTGKQYAQKVSENCEAQWKAAGFYTEAEAKAIEKFKLVFEPQNLLPGSSVLFTHSPAGSLTIAFSKDGLIPEAGAAVIDNKPLTEAVLESIIGEHGVSPAAKQSIASRMAELVSEVEDVQEKKDPDWTSPACMTLKRN